MYFFEQGIFETFHPKKNHPDCRTVCPSISSPFVGDDPRGGPFGPSTSERTTPYLRGLDPTASAHRPQGCVGTFATNAMSV